MEIIERIIKQPNPPKQTNVAWFDGENLKIFTNGAWETISGDVRTKTPPVGDYTLLEYIEGTENQHIPTDIYIKENDVIQCDYELSKYGTLYGTNKFVFDSLTPSNGDISIKFSAYGTNKRMYFRFGDDVNTVVDNVLTEDTQKGTIVIQKGLCSINGVEITELPFKSEVAYPICIFSPRYPSYFRVYGFRVLRDGEIIHNLIPYLRNHDGVPGMLDIVTNRFYVNGGTNELLYEIIPSEPVFDDIIEDNLLPNEISQDKLFITKRLDFIVKRGTNELGETRVYALSSTTKKARGIGFEMKDGHRYKIKIVNKHPDSNTWRMRIAI